LVRATIRRAAIVWSATRIPVFRIRRLPPGDYVVVLAVTDGAR